MLKRPGSRYRPGRQATWRKYKASHRAIATLRALGQGRDGHTYATCDLNGRSVTTLGSPRLAASIGHRVELSYARSMRMARCARSGSARSTPSTRDNDTRTTQARRSHAVSPWLCIHRVRLPAATTHDRNRS